MLDIEQVEQIETIEELGQAIKDIDDPASRTAVTVRWAIGRIAQLEAKVAEIEAEVFSPPNQKAARTDPASTVEDIGPVPTAEANDGSINLDRRE